MIGEGTDLVNDLAVANRYRSLCHLDGIARGVETGDAVDRRAALRVVVAEEYHVETLDNLSHLLGYILLVIGGDDSTVPAAMEESDDDVSLLLFL